MDDGVVAVVPVSRTKALTRAFVWSAPALVLGASAVVLFDQVDLRSSAVSNRLVDYCLALTALLPAIASLLFGVAALGRILLALWPATVAIVAEHDALWLRLGPLGSKRYDVARLDIQYPFEIDDDADEGSFEAFLPEEQQIHTLMPRITHPDSSKPLNRVILAYAGGSERDVVDVLRSAFGRWREQRLGDTNKEAD